MPRASARPSTVTPLLVALTSLVLVACGGADGASMDTSLQEAPCELLTASMVSETFGVPEAELDQTAVDMGDAPEMKSCSYSWSSNGTRLEAGITNVRVRESAERAMDYLVDTTDESVGPTEYRAVEGPWDQARMAAKGEAEPALRVVTGNLYFELEAYHGPEAPGPDLSGLSAEELTDTEAMGERMEEYRQEWMAETYERRLEQARELARAVLEAL